MPRGMKKDISQLFYEFHRVCMELQDVSARQYRSHMDQQATTSIHIKFLLSDIDEKKWGQLLATNEKKRKRDSELQEIFGAFRMVAVELINRVQNYRTGNLRFMDLPVPEAEEYITKLDVEIRALIDMINDALRTVSISYQYAVPYIAIATTDHSARYYHVRVQHFTAETKKKEV